PNYSNASYEILIFVDNHAINHHVVACSNVVDAHGHADFDSRSNGIFIQHPAAPSHIGDGFAKAIMNWSTALPEDNCAPRSVFRDCTVGVGRCRGCGALPLRDLSPCKRGHNCEGYTK